MLTRFALTRRLVISKEFFYTPAVKSPHDILRYSPGASVLAHKQISFFSSDDSDIDIGFYKARVTREEMRRDETLIKQGEPPPEPVPKKANKLSKSRIDFLKRQKAEAHNKKFKIKHENKAINLQWKGKGQRDQKQSRPSVQSNNHSPTIVHTKSSLPKDKINNEPSWSNFDLFVSCLPGLEPMLEMEVKSLGLDTECRAGGVLTSTSSLTKVLECHLCLGTASHVLLRCGGPFKARGFPELERKVSRIPWRKLFKPPIILDVRATCTKSKLYHSDAVADRVKKEIYKSIGMSEKECEDDKKNDRVQVVVRLRHDVVQISVDTSSAPLHQRGYRLQTTKAPLREDLAYGLLLSSGWKPLHHEKQSEMTPPYTKLLDPFCGSGTIAIEAAAMVAGLQPGRLRPSPLRGTRLSSARMWRDVRRSWSKKGPQHTNADINDDIKLEDDDEEILIAASDRDRGAVDAAKANAERAGVDKLIHFTVGAVASHAWFNGDLPPASGSVLVATNPPYGRRVSPNKDLLPLYQTLGEKINNLDDCGAGAAVMSQKVNLARQSGISSLEAAFTSKHGGLSVTAMVTKR